MAVCATGARLTKSGVNDAMARMQGGIVTDGEVTGTITSRPGPGVDDDPKQAQEGHVSHTVVETITATPWPRASNASPVAQRGGDPPGG